jgi:hypothetical protein
MAILVIQSGGGLPELKLDPAVSTGFRPGFDRFSVTDAETGTGMLEQGETNHSPAPEEHHHSRHNRRRGGSL